MVLALSLCLHVFVPPVVPEEVKPKFVKGTKRYGRRSRPDSKPDTALTGGSEDSPPSRTEATDSSPSGVRRAKLRRSTSLESVEVRRSVHPHLPVAPLRLTRFLSKIDSIVLRGAERRDAARALSRTTVFSCRNAWQMCLVEFWSNTYVDF